MLPSHQTSSKAKQQPTIRTGHGQLRALLDHLGVHRLGQETLRVGARLLDAGEALQQPLLLEQVVAEAHGFELQFLVLLQRQERAGGLVEEFLLLFYDDWWWNG